MKKLLGILALTALASSVFAQGTVTLANQTGLIKQWTSQDTSTLINTPKSGGWIQLIAAPLGTPLPNPLFTGNAAGGEKLFANYDSLSGFLAANPGWAAALGPNAGTTPNPAQILLGPGFISGGNYTVANVAAAAQISYAWIGWTTPVALAAEPNTFDEAMIAALAGNSLMGLSAVFTSNSGNPLPPTPTLPVSLKTTFGGITLAPVFVPEPGTFALAGLGLAALLVFRRRS